MTENLEFRKAIQATIPADPHGIERREWSVEAMRAIAAIFLEHAVGDQDDALVGYEILCTMGKVMIAMGVTLDEEYRQPL